MAMLFYQAQLGHIVAKVESVAGTAETLADADFDINCYDISVTPAYSFDDENSKAMTGDHTEDEAIPGMTSATVTFYTKVVWGGAAATEPNWWKLLKGCGQLVTAYTTTGIGVTPEKQEDDATLTMGFYLVQGGSTPAAISINLSGAMGNCVISADGIGSSLRAQFTFTGKLTDIPAVANASILKATGLDTTIAEKLKNVTFTVGSVVQYINTFSLDFGNTIVPAYSQADATGILYYHVGQRRPRFSYDPYILAPGTDDVDALIRAATPQALSLALPTAHFTITAPRCQLLNPSVAVRDDKYSYSHTLKLLTNTAGSTAAEKERTFELLQGAKA
jgi:hypothetical protein